MLVKCWIDVDQGLRPNIITIVDELLVLAGGSMGGGPRVVVSIAAFHARVRGSVPGLGGLKETKMFLPHPRVKVSIVGSLRDREVACSASDRQGANFESCVWRTVSSQSSHQKLPSSSSGLYLLCIHRFAADVSCFISISQLITQCCRISHSFSHFHC